MSKIKYKIRKVRKSDMSTVGYLAQSKVRWRTHNSKYKHGLFTEEQANEFIDSKTGDTEYYYFKTISL